MFSGLEQQRDQLIDAVGGLRQFEARYRQNLSGHLKQQLQVIDGHREPDSTPALLDGQDGAGQLSDSGSDQGSDYGSDPAAENDALRGRRGGDEGQPATDPATNGGSETPRLDALLGDH